LPRFIEVAFGDIDNRQLYETEHDCVPGRSRRCVNVYGRHFAFLKLSLN